MLIASSKSSIAAGDATSTEPVETRPARSADLPAISALLGACDLPSDDLGAEALCGFCVAEAGQTPVGCVGIEVFGSEGLLRSLAVCAPWRKRGLGMRLLEQAEARARQAGVERLYLLTTTAADYFLGLGYAECARAAAPAAIAAHAQFQRLCPASARCLFRPI